MGKSFKNGVKITFTRLQWIYKNFLLPKTLSGGGPGGVFTFFGSLNLVDKIKLIDENIQSMPIFQSYFFFNKITLKLIFKSESITKIFLNPNSY
jgi:hypothetical protein